jgi:hypothetical protein
VNKHELRDLSKLAVERCRAAFMSVGQLVEDDVQRSGMLATVALDLLRGAAILMAERREITEDEALVLVFNTLAHSIEDQVNKPKKKKKESAAS